MKKRKIYISKKVIKKMEKLTVKYNDTENGGYIFGKMNPEWVRVLDVSDAGRNAKRTFSKVEFDNDSLLEYVKEKLQINQFLIGTWHSHPRNYSLIPSKLDQSTMININNYFDSTHAPIFIITGIHDGNVKFSIYKINKFGEVIKDMNYEIIDCEG
ncbi:hypothetical protein E2L07_19840 [Halalkalibacterium halodurans]|jgi:proteasome lid subunit RPN8/RPN11|uniref:Mov34/MPN/PAD-1 family protein n=1 Tax=Bacillaceae TaxID=186817 RepID=UPI001068CF60|nr:MULTISPECIES: Mov34/MPN/PAD-1 family protein [Bacillaceae]TES46004.1 hypothetical protein E2L07_19840 [Halalkalibacterium halodurans]